MTKERPAEDQAMIYAEIFEKEFLKCIEYELELSKSEINSKSALGRKIFRDVLPQSAARTIRRVFQKKDDKHREITLKEAILMTAALEKEFVDIIIIITNKMRQLKESDSSAPGPSSPPDDILNP